MSASTPEENAKLHVPSENFVKLQFSDGRHEVIGMKNVNAILLSIGVRTSTIAIPEAAKPILKASQFRAIRPKEQSELINLFNLHRGQLLEQIDLAGRAPMAIRGGYLHTAELDSAPYPRVFDMKALNPETHRNTLKKYGRLHVNTSDNGMSVDEVVTVVLGGPFTWIFVLPDGVLARLTINQIKPDGPAVRLSYSGLGMHAGFMEPEQGLIVAFAHGPENFTIRYEEPSVPYAELLGTNAWVDFSGDIPKLRDKVS